nr:Crp/Fnr family transcriptional regulator [Aquisalinus flavus]
MFRRLSYYAKLADHDGESLSKLSVRDHSYAPGEDIIRRGEKTGQVFVIKHGWAVRYITLEDGRTQVLNFMLPGDIFDLQVFLDDTVDHSVAAVTKVTTTVVNADSILSLFAQGSSIAAALWWSTVQEEGILREQIVRNGRRTARERVAHLILELHRRARIVGAAGPDSLELPVSQILIADALGLSFVHVNRVLRSLEKEGLIKKNKGVLTILARSQLIEACGYSEEHLHLDGPPRRLSFMAVAE